MSHLLKENRTERRYYRTFFCALCAVVFLVPKTALATQFHSGIEGIITHQVGHFAFLFSMITLAFTINRKGLNQQKGWRYIQYSTLLFVLWNLVTITSHFIDNQIHAVSLTDISFFKAVIKTKNNSRLLAMFYYFLKLDHLLCVPAILFFYNGVSCLVRHYREEQK